MRSKQELDIVDVVIPAYNEERSIGLVLNDIPTSLVRHVIVCNNNSTDRTKMVAQDKGAIVVDAPKKGYGSACLKGLAYLDNLEDKSDIVVFLDGDYSDYPQEMSKLLFPIRNEGKDLVIGSRALGNLERGSMQMQQIFGNWLATTLIRLFYKYEFTEY